MRRFLFNIGLIMVLFVFLSNPAITATPDLTPQLTPEQIYGLSESEWNEFQTIDDPVHYPLDTLALLVSRMRQPLVQSIMSDLLPEESDRKSLKNLLPGSVRDFESDASVFVVSIQKWDYLSNNNSGTISDTKIHVEGIDRFYLCRLRTAEGQEFFCLTPKVPQDWKIEQKSETVFEPPIKTGFFGVQVSSQKENKRIPIFVTTRMRWYPHTLLGDYGMDVSSFDTVAPIPLDTLASQTEKTRFTAEQLQVLRFTLKDREPFYQLLHTAAVIPQEIIERNLPEEPCSVVDLFNRPQNQQGRLVRLTGVARRIERIAIDDEQIVKHFGFDHYYQLALFTADSQSNPLIFCIKNIPEGLPTGNQDDFHVALSICGFFYKTWAYKKAPQKTPQAGTSDYQFAPLLIGSHIEWFQLPNEPKSNSQDINALSFTSSLFVVLIFLWIAVRCFSRRKKVY